MKIATMSDLYLYQIQDMYSCEKQLIVVLGKMIKAAKNPALVTGLDALREETREQMERLKTILAGLDASPGRKVCAATVGLAAECDECIKQTEPGFIRDAGLIIAAQKAEHYEIASYECLYTYALRLDRKSDLELIQLSLSEEIVACESLASIATLEVFASATASI